MAEAARFAPPRRAVVKIGSSSLRGVDGGLDRDMVIALVAQVASLHTSGTEVVLVSSGAVAAGLAPLGMFTRPGDLPGLQAAASVGQGLLMHTYQAAFAEHGIPCGQVLLTPDDVVERARYLNARHTFDRLLELRAVPVVNENDTVATDELRFGDNDRLAALVTGMLGAEVLVLLSDVEGLLAGDPSRQPDLPVVDRVDDIATLDVATLDARRFARSGSAVGTGGMASKIEAARIATFSGAHVVIANARRPQAAVEAMKGRHVGTWFPPGRQRPESRKLWIAFARTPTGRLIVDAGAVQALRERGSSLLAAGVVAADGEFDAGDAVDVVGPDGRIVARGLVSYRAPTVRKLLGRSTRELGPQHQRAVIHRDSMAVIA